MNATIIEPGAEPVTHVIEPPEGITGPVPELELDLSGPTPKLLKVRPWERGEPRDVQETLCNLRREVTAANVALRSRNREIRELRSEARLLRRVMRLKSEGP